MIIQYYALIILVNYMNGQPNLIKKRASIYYDENKIDYNVGQLNLSENFINKMTAYGEYVKNADKIRDLYVSEKKSNNWRSDFDFTNRIIGGEPARLNDVRWFAQILNFTGNGRLCGGFSFASRGILTSKHCIVNINDFKKLEFQVRVNSVVLGYGQLIQIKQIIINEDYDLALLITETIQHDFLRLSTRDEIPNEKAEFFGFGVIGFEGSKPMIPENLQHVKLKIIRQNLVDDLLPEMIPTTGRLTSGDSGGGL